MVVTLDAKQPLGIRNTIAHPIKVLFVRPDGQAGRVGIQEGMTILLFNGMPIASDGAYSWVPRDLTTNSSLTYTRTVPVPSGLSQKNRIC